jgi:predicted HTH domain antitoxin
VRPALSEIRIEIDEDVLGLLGESTEQIERHALEMIVLELYRRHTLSAGRAAMLLGMDKLSFIRWSGSLGIPYFDLTAEELREELKILGGS